MMFRVNCEFLGKRRSVTWRGGRLTGDSMLVRVLEADAKACEAAGEVIGLAGSGVYAEGDYLADPHTALAFVRRSLENLGCTILSVEADIPPLPPVPPGAIA